MEENTLFFFNKRPEAIPLYEVFESRLLSELEGVVIQPQKSQITLKNRRVFGAVSFLPARKAKDRPDPYLTITVGLNRLPTSFCMMSTGLTPPCSEPTTGLRSA